MKLLSKWLGIKADTMLFFAISVATAIISYFYQVYLGNKLSVSNYGIFNTLYAFCVNFSSFFSPIGIYLCCTMAENEGVISKTRKVIRGILIFGLLISLAIAVAVVIIVEGSYSGRFMMSNLEAALLIIMAIVSSGYYNIILSGIQGTSRMIVFGSISLLNALLRFLISAVGVNIISLPEIPVLAFFISNIICGLVSFALLKAQESKENDITGDTTTFDVTKLMSFYGKTFIANIIYSYYVNGGELILLSNRYDTEQVGIYSLLITIAKSSIYLVSMLATVMLPRFAKGKQDQKDVMTKYLAVIMIAFVGGVSWIIFLKYVGIHIIPVLFGRGYADVLQYVSYVSMWVVFLGMLCMTNAFYMGTNDLNGYIIVLGFVSAVIYLILRFGNLSFWYMPIIFGIGVSLIELWSIISTIIKRRRYLL